MRDCKRLAPEVFRQRMLIEGYYRGPITRKGLRERLLLFAERLELRTYGEPVIYSPESGMGKAENAGYDAFVPLIDSGISIYVWTGPKFISLVLYTCKRFDEATARSAATEIFELEDPIDTLSF